MRFSSRVPASVAPNRLAEVRARCGPLEGDLTVSNPTVVGISYPAGLLVSLTDPAGHTYAPSPCGLRSARDAVAAELRRRTPVDPEHIILTASTSEAYSLLFKLLCEAGDGVAVPTPSYPLFEHLARADGVAPLPYHLDRDAGWRLDLGALAAMPGTVRAVVVVHPNNPTGSYVHPDDGAALAALCAERGWALIADEVFLDYRLDGGPGEDLSFADTAPCLTFTLGGLSKSRGLPQLKLGWIAVSGPATARCAAIERLEFLADTYLSVATPVQLALPRLLAEGVPVRDALAARCRENLAAFRSEVAERRALEVPPVGGGWSAILRYPAVVDEEALALELLERDGVAVHPGFMFDFAHPGYLVVSLLPAPDRFRSAIRRLVARLAAHGISD